MLRLSNVGRDGLGYYLDPSLVDIERGDASGRYLGRLAAEIGLGDVPADAFSLPGLLGGVDPLTGELLHRLSSRVTVLAYDCTFAAPKGVSLVALLDEEVPEVVDAHRRSAAAALGYLERHAAVVSRRTEGRLAAVPVEGIAAAAFLHRTSRSDDPHLHSHVLVANFARTADGRFSALDGRALYEARTTAGALYRCQLRYELAVGFGLAWKAHSRGFNDVSGFSSLALSEFSRRKAEIAAELARTGGSGPAATVAAAHHTRRDKDRSKGAAALVDEWRLRGELAGVAPSHLSDMRAPGTLPTKDVAEVVRQSAERFGGRFSRSQLLEGSCELLANGAPIAALEVAVDEVLRTEQIVEFHPRGQRLGADRSIPPSRLLPSYSTRSVHELQQANLERMATAVGLVPEDLPARGLYRAADLAAVARFAERAAAAELPVSGLAVAPGVAAHLEGLTGLSSSDLRKDDRLPDGAIVVFGAGQFSARRLDGLLDRGDRQLVVLVDRQAPLGPLMDSAGQSVELERVGGVRVHRAAGPVAALDAFRRLEAELAAAGTPIVRVSLDPLLVGHGAVQPHRVRQALGQEPAAVALVLGPARLLGQGLRGTDDAHRIHVVVDPARHGRPSSQAVLLEIAAPRALAEELGTAPRDREGRARWQQAVERQGESILRQPTQHLAGLKRERLVREPVEHGWGLGR